MTKRCSKCKETKDVAEFPRDKRRRDGLQAQCKACANAYYTANRERLLEKRKAHYKANRERALEYSKAYNVANRERRSERRKAYQTQRLQVDQAYKAARNLRTRFRMAVRKQSKTGSAVSDLGMPIADFLLYIESLWQPGMSWDNYGNGPGTWAIDHMYPLNPKCGLDLTVRANVLAVCNWQNLQPLWFEDNMAKGNAVTPEAQDLFDELVAEFSVQQQVA